MYINTRPLDHLATPDRLVHLSLISAHTSSIPRTRRVHVHRVYCCYTCEYGSRRTTVVTTARGHLRITIILL